MPKFIITYDCGLGATSEVVEASTLDEAKSLAYEAAVEESENSMTWEAEEWTEAREKELQAAPADEEVEDESETKTEKEKE